MKYTDIAIIGGGLAGSTAAAMLVHEKNRWQVKKLDTAYLIILVSVLQRYR